MMESLPNEVLRLIYQYVGAGDVFSSLARTCKRFADLARDSTLYQTVRGATTIQDLRAVFGCDIDVFDSLSLRSGTDFAVCKPLNRLRSLTLYDCPEYAASAAMGFCPELIELNLVGMSISLSQSSPSLQVLRGNHVTGNITLRGKFPNLTTIEIRECKPNVTVYVCKDFSPPKLDEFLLEDHYLSDYEVFCLLQRARRVIVNRPTQLARCIHRFPRIPDKITVTCALTPIENGIFKYFGVSEVEYNELVPYHDGNQQCEDFPVMAYEDDGVDLSFHEIKNCSLSTLSSLCSFGKLKNCVKCYINNDFTSQCSAFHMDMPSLRVLQANGYHLQLLTKFLLNCAALKTVYFECSVCPKCEFPYVKHSGIETLELHNLRCLNLGGQVFNMFPCLKYLSLHNIKNLVVNNRPVARLLERVYMYNVKCTFFSDVHVPSLQEIDGVYCVNFDASRFKIT